jgi:hypothetical protein
MGAYSAIVKVQETDVWAEDEYGKTIAQGKAGVDDASVILKANNSINNGETLFISVGEYIINKKLQLKNINLIGGGKNTVLQAADNLNDDIIEIYSGGNIDWRDYYRHGRIAHLRVNGNRDNQTSGNGIVLAWTQHYILEDLRVEYCKDFGIKVLRSYWTHLRDCWVRYSGNGIRIGEYDVDGKYGTPTRLFSNQNLLENVHCEYIDNVGIHLDDCVQTTLLTCDTSTCDIGVLAQSVNGSYEVRNTSIINHWCEGNRTLDVYLAGGGTGGTRYTTLVNGVFTTGLDLSGDSYHLVINSGAEDMISVPMYRSIRADNFNAARYLTFLATGAINFSNRYGYIQEGGNTLIKIDPSTLTLYGRLNINSAIYTIKGVFPITLGTQSIAAGTTALAAKFAVPTGKTLKIHAIAQLYDPDGQISAEVYNVTDAVTVASVDGIDDTGWSVGAGKVVEFRVINADTVNPHDGNYSFLVSFV